MPLETKLTKALTMPYQSKGLGPDKKVNVSSLEVVGFQLNARKAPFVNLKRIAQSAPRPASIVVFTRSNLVRFAIALWRDRLDKDKTRCEREIGRNATTPSNQVTKKSLRTAKSIPKKTSLKKPEGRRLRKSDKKDKDKKKEPSPPPLPPPAVPGAPDTAPTTLALKTPVPPLPPKNVTKKTKTSFFSPKKKEKCEEPGKARLPVPEFEAWLRDAFWKLGTLTGVAVSSDTDYYEVTYEDAHRNRDQMTRDLMDFLGKRPSYQRVRQEELGKIPDPAAV